MQSNNTVFLLLLSIATWTPTTAVIAGEVSLEKLWELDGLSKPESVVYDKRSNALYVSNINGSPMEKDGNGFISKVSLQGKLIANKWVTGLDAPKGLAIHDNKLYVTDIDSLVEIDMNTATILNRYKAEGGKFLNDITAAEDGTLFISDSRTNTLYRFNGSMEKWMTSAAFDSPNGLLAETGRLVVGTMGTGFTPDSAPGQLLAVSRSNRIISYLTHGRIALIDGVEADLDHNGYYVTANLNGELLHISNLGEVKTLLKIEPGMADHEYIREKDMIIMPFLRSGKLLAYKLLH
ncbi:MAG: SMP-30/gluconolactonase/LRE family protein [Gammaproteobacteria bacterium]